MKNVYDNGALMLGNIKDVIKEVEKEIMEDIDMIFADKDEILKELKELESIDDEMIVCINYEKQDFDITYWNKEDKIKEV